MESGGQLDHDTVDPQGSAAVENIYFTESAPEGEYTYWVNLFQQRGESPDDFVLSVWADEALVVSHVGTGSSEEFIYERKGDVDVTPRAVQSLLELQIIVNSPPAELLDENSFVSQAYGYPMGNWDVSQVTSFNETFIGYIGPDFDLNSWDTR